MLTFSSDLLQGWVVASLIPLTRILSFIAVAPFFNSTAINTSVKLAFGILLASIITPAIPDLPAIDLLSLPGFMVIGEQMLIGLAMGLMAQIVFTAIDLAGQLCGMTMGFGFATFFDPQSQGSTVVISKFLGILGILVFLSIDGHLLMISALLESFHTFPVTLEPQNVNGMVVALWGKQIFSIGLQLSLPVVAALLITNAALAILTKSAPQLNIFGIGFPVTILVGFIVILLMLPSMAVPLQSFIKEGISAGNLVLKLQ